MAVAVAELAQLVCRLANEDFHILKEVKESFDLDVVVADLTIQDVVLTLYLDKPSMI